MKKTASLIILSAGVILLSAFSLLSGGIVNTTGSPGEGTCAGCHTGGPAGTTVSISTQPAFINNEYDPNTTYTVTIIVSNQAQSKFGFDCEILNASNANAGTMANAGAGATFSTQALKKNALHTTPKAGVGSATWTFEWTSPGSGNATFYVAGNAVNGSNSTAGDSPATVSLALTPSSATSIDEAEEWQISLNVFPNPSTDLMQASYYLKSSEEVNIELLEINGKLVKNLLNTKDTPGPHNQILDLKGIAKGIYFLKITAGEEKSQKLIFVQ